MIRRSPDLLAAGALLLLAAVGLLDLLVLLPSLLAPTTALPAVWGAVTAAGDLAPVTAGAVLWTAICAVLAARHLRARRPSSPRRVGAIALIELGVLAVLEQGAVFGLNLWLSDHLPPFEGGTTGLGSALLLLGAVAIVAGAVALAISASRRRADTSAPA